MGAVADGNLSSVGGAASALNVAKLKLGKQYTMENEVDLDAEPIYQGITAKDHAALLDEIQIISSDSRSKWPAVSTAKFVIARYGIE